MQQGMPCGAAAADRPQAAKGRVPEARGRGAAARGQLGAAALVEQGRVRGKGGMQACNPKQRSRLHLGPWDRERAEKGKHWRGPGVAGVRGTRVHAPRGHANRPESNLRESRSGKANQTAAAPRNRSGDRVQRQNKHIRQRTGTGTQTRVECWAGWGAGCGAQAGAVSGAGGCPTGTHASTQLRHTAAQHQAAPAAASTLPTGGPRARGLGSWGRLARTLRVLGWAGRDAGHAAAAGWRCRPGGAPTAEKPHKANTRSCLTLAHQLEPVFAARAVGCIGVGGLALRGCTAQCRLATTAGLGMGTPKPGRPTGAHTHRTEVLRCAARAGRATGVLGSRASTAAEPWVELRPPLPSLRNPHQAGRPMESVQTSNPNSRWQPHSLGWWCWSWARGRWGRRRSCLRWCHWLVLPAGLPHTHAGEAGLGPMHTGAGAGAT